MNKKEILLLVNVSLLLGVILLAIFLPEDDIPVDDVTFFESINLDYPGMGQVRAAVIGGNYTLAKSELLKYYQSRPEYSASTPYGRSYFPLPTTGNVERANMNLQHYFDLGYNESEVSPYYFRGTNIDWLTIPNSTNKRVWVGAFNYHWWMPNLGAVYSQTNDEKYAQEWIYEISDWINDSPSLGVNNSDFLSNGLRMQSWVISYQYFINLYNSPSINPDQHTAMLKSIQKQADRLISKDERGNHGTFGKVGLLEIAIMFPEFKSANKWQNNAVSGLEKHLISDIYADGMGVEPPMYMSLGGSGGKYAYGYTDAYRLAKLNNLNIFSEAFESRLEKGVEYHMFITKPNKILPSIGDTIPDTDDNIVIGMGADLFNRQDMKYIYTSGANGTAPDEISNQFPIGGNFIMRSGFGDVGNFDQQLYLIFIGGPYGGWHDHYDWLSFEAYAYGKDLIVDGGQFIYYTEEIADGKNWHYYAKSTRSHNTIVVDGHDQVLYPDGPLPDYKTKALINNNGSDFVEGWLSSKNYDVDHERSIFFVRNEYWIISDVLKSKEKHTFDLFFHLPAISWGKTTLDTTSKVVSSTGNNLIILPADPSGISASLIDDWVNNRFTRAPTVKYTRSNVSVPTSFDTVIYPFPKTAPTITLSRLTVSRNTIPLSPYKASGLRIDIGSNTDYYLISHDTSASTKFGMFQFDGKVAYLRKDSSGNIINIQIKDGSELIDNENILASIYGTKADISSSGGIIEMSGTGITKFKIWAPDAILVKINGEETEFTQVGGYAVSNGTQDEFDLVGLLT